MFLALPVIINCYTFIFKVLISRPGAENSANYQVTGARTYTNNVPNDGPDTLKPFVAYTADGQAQVSIKSSYKFGQIWF